MGIMKRVKELGCPVTGEKREAFKVKSRGGLRAWSPWNRFNPEPVKNCAQDQKHNEPRLCPRHIRRFGMILSKIRGR